MFGYIRPHMPDLRLRDHQYYRGVYCGLCRAMGRCTGQCSRFTLSYDLTFLSLVRLALANGNPSKSDPDAAVRFERRRCLLHPFRPRPSLCKGNATDYAACVSAVLAYYKLLDDRADETGHRRLRARLALPHARRFCRRAERSFPGLTNTIAPLMCRLAQAEATAVPSADEPAEAFGQLLGTLFAYELEGARARIGHTIGRHIGRWLYLLDAVDDYAEDAKRKRPNPLHRLYGDSVLTHEHRTHLEAALALELRRAADALDLLEIDPAHCGAELSPLLYHMLQLSLPSTAHRILFPTSDDQSTKKASDHDHDGSL